MDDDDGAEPQTPNTTEAAGTGEPEPAAPADRRELRELRELSTIQWMLKILAILALTILSIYGLALLPDVASLPIVAGVAAGYLAGLSLWRRR